MTRLSQAHCGYLYLLVWKAEIKSSALALKCGWQPQRPPQKQPTLRPTLCQVNPIQRDTRYSRDKYKLREEWLENRAALQNRAAPQNRCWGCWSAAGSVWASSVHWHPEMHQAQYLIFYSISSAFQRILNVITGGFSQLQIV